MDILGNPRREFRREAYEALRELCHAKKIIANRGSKLELIHNTDESGLANLTLALNEAQKDTAIPETLRNGLLSLCRLMGCSEVGATLLDKEQQERLKFYDSTSITIDVRRLNELFELTDEVQKMIRGNTQVTFSEDFRGYWDKFYECVRTVNREAQRDMNVVKFDRSTVYLKVIVSPEPERLPAA
jgi:hypothetical protein